MEAGAQISPTHRCPGGSRAGDVFTTAFVEAFVGRCSYSGGLRPADCSHSLICEPASAWLALRKSSSRAGPGGSFLASSFSRLASSARRFSRDSFCLMRRRSMLLSPVLADPTPHGSALAIYNAWDRESVPQIELGHSAIRLRALGLKYRQYPRLEPPTEAAYAKRTCVTSCPVSTSMTVNASPRIRHSRRSAKVT